MNDCCNVVRLRMNFLLPAQVDFFLTFPNYKILSLSNSSNILLFLVRTTSLRLLTAEMWCDIISANSSTIPVDQGICHLNVSVFSTISLDPCYVLYFYVCIFEHAFIYICKYVLVFHYRCCTSRAHSISPRQWSTSAATPLSSSTARSSSRCVAC